MTKLGSLLLALPLFLLVPGCAASTDDNGLEPMGEQESEIGAATRKLPDFDGMWDAYPRGEAEAVKDLIGGAVDADWIANTCTIRLSRSLNYAGYTVPNGPKAAVKGLHTVKGADKMNYAYRVAEFRDYLRKVHGAPTFEKKNADGSAGIDPAAFEGRKGIILFEVKGWSDATGHADLWNGTEAAGHAYWEEASRVQIWEAE